MNAFQTKEAKKIVLAIQDLQNIERPILRRELKKSMKVLCQNCR